MELKNAEIKMRAKELEDRYKDLQDVHYHSGPNSTGMELSHAANGSQSDFITDLRSDNAEIKNEGQGVGGQVHRSRERPLPLKAQFDWRRSYAN